MSTNGTSTLTRPTKPIWPTKECGRCGGTGRYSWCQMYGDTCFNCSGSGRAFANKKVAEIVIGYRASLKAQREAIAQDIAPGQKVYVSDGRLQSRKDGNGEWVEVFEVTIPDMQQWSGKSVRTMNGHRHEVVTSWRTVITLVDGTVHQNSGNAILRTFAEGIDPAPFMARCAAALGKTSKAAARAEYETQLTEAGWLL